MELKLIDTEKLALIQHLLISNGNDNHSKLERIVEVIMELDEAEIPRN